MGYQVRKKIRIFSDNKALERIGKVGDQNARVQMWFEFLTAFDYTVECRKDSANGNAVFPSRLPSPPQNTTEGGLAASPPLRTAVSSSPKPAGFALALRRPLVSV